MSGRQFLWCLYDNKKEEIVRLLQQGMDVNEKDLGGWTALYRACWIKNT